MTLKISCFISEIILYLPCRENLRVKTVLISISEYGMSILKGVYHYQSV